MEAFPDKEDEDVLCQGYEPKPAKQVISSETQPDNSPIDFGKRPPVLSQILLGQCTTPSFSNALEILMNILLTYSYFEQNDTYW